MIAMPHATALLPSTVQHVLCYMLASDAAYRQLCLVGACMARQRVDNEQALSPGLCVIVANSSHNCMGSRVRGSCVSRLVH